MPIPQGWTEAVCELFSTVPGCGPLAVFELQALPHLSNIPNYGYGENLERMDRKKGRPGVGFLLVGY